MAADITHNFATSGFSDALVILGAAGIVIPAFTRFRVSPVIGFILVGALVGPAGLGSLVGQAPWLSYVTISNPGAIGPFAEFGIIMLLFSIGMELSFPRLWSMRRLVFGVGAAELIGSTLIIGAALMLLGTSWAPAFALGVALALSSTAVVLPLVGTASAVGRSALAMLLFEDVALVPIIFVLGFLGPGGSADSVTSLVDIAWKGGLAIAAILLFGRFLLPALFAQAARAKSPELFLAASLIVVIVASLMTAAVGLSPIAGALLAGIMIAETEYHDEVEAMTAPFRGLGLGVFLITVGMSLDILFIAERWEHLLMALIGVMAIKALVTGALLRLSGASKSVAAEAGVLMAAPSETTLIVLAAAGAAGLLSAETSGFWQIVTALGLTLTPLLARIGRDVARRVTRPGDSGEGKVPTRDEPRAVIIGFGRVGRLVADMLAVHNRPYVAVDSDIDCVGQALKDGYHVMYGDATRSEFVDKLNLGHASALILTMDDPVLSMRLVKRVRAWAPDLCIVVRARDAGHAAELYRAGATDAVPETLESSLQLSEAVLVDLGMPMGPVIASIHEKRAEMRAQIMEMGELDREPNIRRTRVEQVGAEPG
jgi:CPA2 family monovalent cation:H+ antiporter-2